MAEQQNQIICFAGRKGSGKSYLLRETLRDSRRLFCFDTQGEHRWIPDEFEDLDAAIMYLLETHCWTEFAGRFVSDSEDDDGTTDELREICSTVYQQGNMLFCVEEIASLGMGANYAPGPVKKLTRRGRHRNIDFVYTTQRIAEVWIGLRQATDIYVIFAQSEPADIKAIAERCGQDVAERVAALQGHEHVIFDVNEKRELPTIVLLEPPAPTYARK